MACSCNYGACDRCHNAAVVEIHWPAFVLRLCAKCAAKQITETEARPLYLFTLNDNASQATTQLYSLAILWEVVHGGATRPIWLHLSHHLPE